MDGHENSGLIIARSRVLEKEFPSEDQAKEFFFVQAADTQLGMIANYDPVEGKTRTMAYEKGLITWDEEIRLCEKMVCILNNMDPKPEFAVICGDLLDAFPERFPKTRAKQEVDFKRIFKKCKVPIICVCGNHDVGDSPTPETLKSYEESFGKDYFSFWVKGVKFLAINSQFYENRSQCPHEAEEYDRWLDSELKDHTDLHQGKPLVILQHIPWFINDPKEDKIYFNVEEPIRSQMLEKFYAAGIKAVFCGHYHRNAGGFYKDMEVVITSAVGCQIGSDGHGFRVVNISSSGSITHEYKTLDSF